MRNSNKSLNFFASKVIDGRGRPALNAEKQETIKRLRYLGLTNQDIAFAVKVSIATAMKYGWSQSNARRKNKNLTVNRRSGARA